MKLYVFLRTPMRSLLKLLLKRENTLVYPYQLDYRVQMKLLVIIKKHHPLKVSFLFNPKTAKISLLFLLFSSFLVVGQKNAEVLFRIDKQPVYVSEFKQMFEKNLDIVESTNKASVENYVELFINFKLKLKEAYYLKLDTLQSYITELNGYKDQLMAPYLQDTAYVNTLIKDAYHRTKYKLRASHILVRIPTNSPRDTLKAFQKIMDARNRISKGALFSKVAKEISDDKSASSNGGDLGYFSAFKMVYAFEDVAFNTKVGSISMPFRSKFGYHIVKVFDKKLSKGRVKVSHILIDKNSNNAKGLVDSLHAALTNGSNFNDLAKEFSSDKNTAKKGGVLPLFEEGNMIPVFEKQAFELKQINQISKPFQTQYGWHIIKLLQKLPVTSFKELKPALTSKIKSSGLANLSKNAVLTKLKKKYNVYVVSNAIKIFEGNPFRSIPRDSLQQPFLYLGKSLRTQNHFYNYAKRKTYIGLSTLINNYVNEETMSYYKSQIEFEEPTYAASIKEFKEGLLLFELMQRKIWNKSSKDTIGLQTYFYKNKNNYTFKELSKNKGAVINDYQAFLEKEWLQYLRKKYPISLRKRIVKKLVQHYQNK